MSRVIFLLIVFSTLDLGSFCQALGVEDQLGLAGDNVSELRRALDEAPEDQQFAMEFLIAHMPERDLKSLSADHLLENVDLACKVWRESAWHDQVSEDLFLNNILPYASINERRDNWRKQFYEKFSPIVQDAKSPGEAAVLLNRKMFKLLNVKYSTKRAKADQSPFETMESGLASCTGLSVLLIDACRAVGVPARFVGTPLWSDMSGNHSWVEVWDGGWHFTGAAEPTGKKLDQGWFKARAALAQEDQRRHAIFATSFKRTPVTFPCVWSRNVDYVSAVNVTSNYTAGKQELQEGHGYARFQALNESSERVQCKLTIQDEAGNLCHSGTTRDEGFDTNNHLSFPLELNKTFLVTAEYEGRENITEVNLQSEEQLFTIRMLSSKKISSSPAPLDELKTYLAQPQKERGLFQEHAFATIALTKEQAEEARKLLWDDHVAFLQKSRADEMEARKLTLGKWVMPFAYKVFGEKPEEGRSLYISMHGGGKVPKSVNDRQWQNQQQLYKPPEGVYLAPRAPTDDWNLWHKRHVDRLFARLIENMIVFEDVNPNRVYIMGYSAGGDGTYQLAPRMADRWAAAAMMAGHPNDSSPLGLRNIGFAIYMGGRDSAYNRNALAAKWKEKLEKLRQDDPGGYFHQVNIYPEKGHWMDREDAASIDWMQKQTRNPFPQKVVWKQDGITHSRFYWLATPTPKKKALVVATRTGQSINIESSEVSKLTILLNDQMLDLDQAVHITSGDKVLFEGEVPRTLACITKTLSERGDPQSVFSASVDVTLE